MQPLVMKYVAPGLTTLFLRSIIFIILFLFSSVLNVTAQQFERVWQEINYGSHFGSRGLGVVDLDGNGTEEVLMSAQHFDRQSYFTILAFENGRYVQQWMSEFYPEFREIRAIEWADSDNDTVYEIYVLTDNGSLDIYDGATLERDTTLQDLFSLQAAHPIDTEMHAADVDNDGGMELVIVDLFDLTIFDIDALQVVRDSTYSFRSTDFEIGDVDMDGEQEIVFSGGAVVDGATGDVEWQYTEDFGRQIALVDVDMDGLLDIVGIENEDKMTAFDLVDEAMLWQIDTGEFQDVISIADVNNDGRDEIIVGNGQWGDLVIYDPETQEVTGSIRNPDNGTTNLAVGDPDGDGTKEILWGGNAGSTAADHLYFLDPGTMSIESHIGGFTGGYALDIADVDNDQHLELITTHNIDGDFSEVNLWVFDDAEAGLAVQDTVLAPFGTSRTAAGADINGDDKTDIVIATLGRIFILDGTTHEVMAENQHLLDPLLMKIGDVDADGIKEIVLGGADGEILVLDAQTLETEWEGLDVGRTMNALEIKNLDNDAALEIVTLSLSEISSEFHVIRVYDGQTQTPEGQYPGLVLAKMLIIDDFDQNGTLEFIVPVGSSEITLVDVGTLTFIERFKCFESSVASLALANVDDTPEPELIIGGRETLSILNTQTRERIWQSEILGEQIGERGQLFVTDFDGDEFIDIIFTSSIGYHWLEATEPSDTGGSGTSSMQEEAIPQAFVLHQNYPNPFNPQTTIAYEVPVASHVTIEVFNLAGQRVSTLQDGVQPAGQHTVTWKADQMSSGVYVYRMRTGGFTATRRVVLLR